MREVRCEKCNKLLAKTTGEAISKSESVTIHTYKNTIEIKCPRCGKLNEIIITEKDLD